MKPRCPGARKFSYLELAGPSVLQVLLPTHSCLFLAAPAVMLRGMLSPPAGLLSDEEVIVSPMFESTSADLASVVRKDLLSDCSVISTSLEDKQQVKKLESGSGVENDILSLLVVHIESSMRSLAILRV